MYLYIGLYIHIYRRQFQCSGIISFGVQLAYGSAGRQRGPQGTGLGPELPPAPQHRSPWRCTVLPGLKIALFSLLKTVSEVSVAGELSG